jgi:hypothetical protein
VRVQNCVPSNETKEMLQREHGGMFARIATVKDFTPGRLTEGARLEPEPINSEWSVDVRFSVHFGPKSDIA